MMPAIKKPFDLMGDEIIGLSTMSETLEDQMGDYDKNS